MKKFLISIVALLAIVALPIRALAENSVSATATATAKIEIIPIIALSKSVDMNFGRVSPSGSDGNCVLTTTNTRVLTNLAEVSGGTVPASSVFVVTGGPGYSYVITLPTSATLSGKSTGKTMTVTNFSARPSSVTTDGLVGTIGTNSYFTVGATLGVEASQAVDTYSGDFEVSVAYN